MMSKCGNCSPRRDAARSGSSLKVDARLLSGDQDEESENFQAGGFYLLHTNLIEVLRELHLEPVADSKDAQNRPGSGGTTKETGNTRTGNKKPFRSASSPPSSAAYLEAAARILPAGGDHSQKAGGDDSSLAETIGRTFYPALAPAGKLNENSADEESKPAARSAARCPTRRPQSVKVEADKSGGRRNNPGLCAGEYFLFGYGRFGDDLLVWQVPVTILPGANAVELDQYNAEVIAEF